MREKPLILVVDDEHELLEIMSIKLTGSGFDTVVAYNGKEAVDAAKKIHPDLILMDIQMPGESGTDAALEIKQDPSMKDIKIAFLSNLKDPWPSTFAPRNGLAKDMGMEDFIDKTGDLDATVAKIQGNFGAHIIAMTTEEELRETKKKLEEIDHFKTHLLALTSHQLKTPMGIIRGYTTLLREGFYGQLSDEVKEVLAKIEFGTEEVIMLVDNIIDLRKVEEGRLEYQKENVDFVKVARQASEEMGHMAMSRGLDLHFSGPDHEIMIYADGDKLRHVIQNLIDNAVKYTKKGSISVKVFEKGSDVLLSVTDSGLGIPKKVIPALFQEFVRDERVKKEIKGTGMGLYIARIFIEAQNGKIWVESEGEDRGSTFYISIPKQ